MPAIKNAREIAEKWAKVTPQRADDYEQGIRTPKKDWQTETSAAAENYAAGVQNAIANNRFATGVSNAGTAKWQKAAIEKGTQRWGPGVRVAQGDYESGFAPYADVISRTTLPPRYAKGDPRNIERVAAMATALHEAKVGGGA